MIANTRHLWCGGFEWKVETRLGFDEDDLNQTTIHQENQTNSAQAHSPDPTLIPTTDILTVSFKMLYFYLKCKPLNFQF